jgi:predicted glycosyltransferase
MVSRRRIILYSHDAMGIGHVRRNLLIAGALVRRRDWQVLLICGVAEAGAFQFPPHVDCLTLPSFRKEANSTYSARRLSLDVRDLLELRASTIRAAAESFGPDLFIVDKVPLGVAGELTDTLEMFRSSAGSTHIVLGLRDVLDDPKVVRREWRAQGSEEAIDRFYDSVWIYGDRNVYDAIEEYGFAPDVAARVRFTGYLRRSAGPIGLDLSEAVTRKRSVICLVGGGEDGGPLALAFAGANLPDETDGLIVTGPFMPADTVAKLRKAVASKRNLRIVDFLREPMPLLAGAKRIITMGGYNAVSEAICAGRPTLVVPRVQPRREQWIRARRLAEMQILDVLHPDELSPDALTQWLARPPATRPSTQEIDFDGLIRIPQFAAELFRQDKPHEHSRRPVHASR